MSEREKLWEQGEASTALAWPRRALIQVLALGLVTLLLFVLIEGLSSIALTTYNAQKRIRSRRPHTHHDAYLGWVAMPNVNIPDAFGKGVPVNTNSRGFRGTREYQPAPPDGKLRAICSGDSFTFGFGVSNENAWCEQLTVLNPHLETINMGQTAYGIDQAYLWYLRDGDGIQHDVHLFAFIGRDIQRMAGREFQGYGKPVLKIEKGRVVVRNTPVKKISWSRRVAGFRELRSLDLLERVAERLGFPRSSDNTVPETELRALAVKIFEQLKELNERRKRLLVIVYLPWIEDYHPDAMSDDRRAFLRSESDRLGVTFVDLTAPFRALDVRDAEALFIREPAPWPTIGIWGHYNVDGNRFAAAQIHAELLASPGFQRRLQKVAVKTTGGQAQ